MRVHNVWLGSVDDPFYEPKVQHVRPPTRDTDHLGGCGLLINTGHIPALAPYYVRPLGTYSQWQNDSRLPQSSVSGATVPHPQPQNMPMRLD
jgi:hypothetical protein